MHLLIDIRYDSDDAMLLAAGGKKKTIEPIPALDHSQIKYADFEKCFYIENEDISLMTEQEVDAYRKELGISLHLLLFPSLFINFSMQRLKSLDPIPFVQ